MRRPKGFVGTCGWSDKTWGEEAHDEKIGSYFHGGPISIGDPVSSEPEANRCRSVRDCRGCGSRDAVAFATEAAALPSAA